MEWLLSAVPSQQILFRETALRSVELASRKVKTDGELLRRTPAAYSDGVYEPSGVNRPNPFDISDRAHKGDSGQGSEKNRTTLMVFFGQQLVEEIMDSQGASCPREFLNIKVPLGHPYNPNNLTDLSMPFLRTRYNGRTGYSPNNPRQQLNEITPYLDGNLVYGAGKAVGDAVRAFKDGMLAAQGDPADIKNSLPIRNNIRLPMANPPSPRDHEMRPVSRFYRLGNPRGNENPFLLTFGVLWFRYHNYLAKEIKRNHSEWDDEHVFNAARKRLIGQYQKIVFKDWLPVWLGNFTQEDYPYTYNESTRSASKNPYNGYQPNVHPGISQEFQTAALRFGHTLVPSGVFIRNNDSACGMTQMELKRAGNHKVTGVRLCNAFWVSQETVESAQIGVDRILLGLAFTKAEKEDRIIVSDLRQEVFGSLDWSRRDLAALNIQRARDHGIPGYNEVRRAYGLPPLNSWEDIIKELHEEPDKDFKDDLNNSIQSLKQLYGSDKPDELDIFVGGLLETSPQGPGPLFRAITLDQFLRIRHGDRFWYENRDNGLFSEEEIQEIENTTLADIITQVTYIRKEQLPDNVFTCSNTLNCDCVDPFKLSDAPDQTENCTTLQHYDYFSGSEVSFALSFLVLFLCIPVTFGIMLLMAKQRENHLRNAARMAAPRVAVDAQTSFPVVEWMGNESGERHVIVELMASRKKIVVHNASHTKTLRLIDLRNQKDITFYLGQDRNMSVMAIRVPGETDLVLRFDTGAERASAVPKMENFLREIRVQRNLQEVPTAHIYRDASTHDDRKKILEQFFRTVTMQVFQTSGGRDEGLGDLDPETMQKIRNIRLTRSEFADSMGLQPTSLFVRNMFLLVDRSRDGFVSFDEFMNMFVTLSKGSARDKAQMLFNMYDLKRQGKLSRADFAKMIRSMLDLAEATVDNEERVDQLIQSMFEQAGISDKSTMTFDDFCKIFASNEHGEILKNATIGLEGQSSTPSITCSHLDRAKTSGNVRNSRVSVRAETIEYPKTVNALRWYMLLRYVETYRLQIFWVILYTLVTFGIFIERAYYYSVEREHAGLRRLAGYGVSVTRGAASGMMFTYASLVITMSRNTLTFFRETFLHRFIPFDSFHAMHKYIAFIALLFTAMHCIGHGINLYHICTQASSDLNCYFTEYFRATHVLASFHYWAWTTITGRLVQDPLWGYYFIGPVVIFTLDKLVSLSRQKVEISVMKALTLPSGVTQLIFKKPINFEYKSGQWVRVACLKLAKNEYNPFTLTSAPHEETLSLHIRAVGPWTNNIRRIYDQPSGGKLPKLYLDGPFGEGHQDWYRFPVSVLVGGGIGVTPFASILKDLVHKSRLKMRFPCQKVYFLWVTRTQKSFEWLTDIIREVEAGDEKQLVEVHIFITQFPAEV
ncbi:hypothetical protein C0Q70_20364 [Pomacea canaliculata]|uniref:NAD(P)H oxidase (H2O2-forming) n=1 Tax=Pomacea canaliculata TaxID=400727 RepID=A0A2T7NFD0_POMCA|nr:hypothetical protein C0Q70_20364 [Pomacea canaliculata]